MRAASLLLALTFLPAVAYAREKLDAAAELSLDDRQALLTRLRLPESTHAALARAVAHGQADEFELSIAGSGSCDAEGLTAEKASVHIAGSGDAIFTCNGEVSAHLMGSGNVIVRGSARCSVHSMGSGTVTCERASEAAD